MKAMTMKEYRASQKRCAELQRIMKDDPAKGRELCKQSFSSFVEKVNAYRSKFNK